MLSDFNLEGKTALVTGASSGIGKEIALVLAEAGADVAVAARRLARIEETADEIRGLGRRAVPIQAAVSASQQVDAMVSQATESLARIDILVNNAGISGAAPSRRRCWSGVQARSSTYLPRAPSSPRLTARPIRSARPA